MGLKSKRNDRFLVVLKLSDADRHHRGARHVFFTHHPHNGLKMHFATEDLAN